MLDDMLFYGVLGVILGGRLGHVLFYQFGYYLQHPLEILAVWQGGMSFHGGFLGVITAMALLARKYKLQWLAVTDFIAPLVPLGLGAGRIGNFINAELWGRPTDVSWGMIFPAVDNIPRHPSQLYEFALEGVAFFLLLWIYSQAKTGRCGFRHVPDWLWGIPLICRVFSRTGRWLHGRHDAGYQHGPMAIAADGHRGRFDAELGLSS